MASIPCKTNPMGKTKEYFSLIVKPGVLGDMTYGFTPYWNSGRYCRVLDWGDGTSEDAVTNGAVLTHTYSVAGTYEIKIVADCYKIIFGKNTAYSKLIYKMNGNVFKLGNLTSTVYMFENCSSLTEIPETLTIPNSVTDCSNMFENCSSLTAIPETLTIPNSVTDCSYMFYYCSSLTAIPSTFTLGNSVIDCMFMFSSCTSLITIPETLTIPNSVTDCRYMFSSCSSLTTIPSTFTLGNSVIGCMFMFNDCTSLITIPETLTIPNSVTDCSHMFENCSSLTSDISNIWPSTWNSTGRIDVSYMFYNCPKVVGTVPADKLWNSRKTFNSYCCFRNCTSLDNYDEIPAGWK